MPRTTYWKGHLKLSLVTAKVSLVPAVTQSNKVRFHILNRETGNRVESRYIDSDTHRPVADRNQVKGYPRDGREDEFVLIGEDEFDAVALESTRTINIETFVPAGSIGWIWYDRPHFLKPEDKISTEAFGVILEAMARQKVVGIGRLVLYGREHAVLLEPSGKGIVLWTLRYGETMREPVTQGEPPAKAGGKALNTLEKKISGKTRDWRPSLVRDPLQKKLKALLETAEKKTKGKKPSKEKTIPRKGNVIDITQALRKSLEADKKKNAS